MNESRGHGRFEMEPDSMDTQRVKLPRLSDGETSVDRISAFPDSLIQHILSFLTVKDLIKTSVLSKRWRFVWAEVPVLRFMDCDDVVIPHFERLVSQTLANYRGIKVQELDIRIHHDNLFTSQVDEWINFATERKVENLHFVVFAKLQNRNQNGSVSYQLPQSVYLNSSLKVLDTQLCDFKISSRVSWTSLRVLSIYYANIDNDALASILLGSPNLQKLEMHVFNGVDKINVTSSNMKLKEIVLRSLGLDMEISAPHVHSLSLLQSTQPVMIKLVNVSSLKKFSVNLSVDTVESLAGLARVVLRVGKVIVGTEFLEALFNCQMLPFPWPLKCRSLMVDARVKEWDFHKIVTLLKTTPAIKKLTIIMDHSSRYKFDDNTKYWELRKTNVQFNCLNTVLITGFEESWCVGSRVKFFTSVVELLLKNATVLEKIFIFAQSKGTIRTPKLPDLSEVNKLISSYPRAPLVVFKSSFRS